MRPALGVRIDCDCCEVRGAHEACEAMELIGDRSESVYRRLAIVAHGDPVEAYTPSRERRGPNRGHRGAVGSGLHARGAS